MSDYLIDLTVKHVDDKEFCDFVSSLRHGAFEAELLRQILPESIRERVFELRSKHEYLQQKKENSVAEERFDDAGDYRDREYAVAKAILQLMASHAPELTVTPALIDATLKQLGYNA